MAVDTEMIERWLQIATRDIHDALRANNIAESTILKVEIGWGAKSMRSCMGKAMYSPVYRIKLSPVLWPHASEEERRDTAIHEACHIAAKIRSRRRPPPHGKLWKECMRRAGISEPKRCHEVLLPI